jgi:hypothetical protein
MAIVRHDAADLGGPTVVVCPTVIRSWLIMMTLLLAFHGPASSPRS